MSKAVTSEKFYEALSSETLSYCVYAPLRKNKIKPILITPSLDKAIKTYNALNSEYRMLSSLANGSETTLIENIPYVKD